MFNDTVIIVVAMILTDIIYGSIAGFSIAKGGNTDRGKISQLFKLFLLMAFPFTLSAIGSAKLVVWMMEEEDGEATN